MLVLPSQKSEKIKACKKKTVFKLRDYAIKCSSGIDFVICYVKIKVVYLTFGVNCVQWSPYKLHFINKSVNMEYDKP